MTEEPYDLVGALEDDLAALAAADADLDRDAEVAERIRIERSRLTLVDRLRAARVRLHVATVAGPVQVGHVAEVGEGWVLLSATPDGVPVTLEHLVLIEAVSWVRGLGREASPRSGTLKERTAMSALRQWCRDRSEVSLVLRDGSVVTGRAEAAYADHLELAGADPRVVALQAIAVVSRSR